MALAKKQSRSSTIIIVAIIVAAFGGLGYFLYDRFVQPGTGPNSPGTGLDQTGVVEFDANVLQDPRLTNLQAYEVPIDSNVNAGQPYPFR